MLIRKNRVFGDFFLLSDDFGRGGSAMKKRTGNDRPHALLGLVIWFLFSAVIFLVFSFVIRALLNSLYRNELIGERLNDYPQMYEDYQEEYEEWWRWWENQDDIKLAEQARFIYENDRAHGTEEEKFQFIKDVLQAETVQIISREDYETARSENAAIGLNTIAADLTDGKQLVITLNNTLEENRSAMAEDTINELMIQLHAGLSGHILLYRNDTLSVYPQDETTPILQEKVLELLNNGTIERHKDKVSANPHEENGGILQGTVLELLNSGKIRRDSEADDVSVYPLDLPSNTDTVFLYTATFESTDDIVINAVPSSEVIRLGRKRSWSLWFLILVISFLTGLTLWKTKLYRSEKDKNRNSQINAIGRGLPVMAAAMLFLAFSVLSMQSLSILNLTSEAAKAEAGYLKNELERECERADVITDEFNSLYTDRVEVAAKILKYNPHLYDIDSLHRLNHVLDGFGIRIMNGSGRVVASDDLMWPESANEGVQYDAELKDESGTSSGVLILNRNSAASAGETVFRTSITREGVPDEVVYLDAGDTRLSELLRDTQMKDVISDMLLMDTIHVAVVDEKKERIVASTYSSWVNDLAQDHGIHAHDMFDGYEGIINFGGNRCYSAVFTFDGQYVIVGSEDVSSRMYRSGILIMFLILLAVMICFVYIPFTMLIYRDQKWKEENGMSLADKNDYPEIWHFIKGFMFALFILSATLYVITSGNPMSLTYNVVRGTWNRGVNTITITTSVMLISVVFAVQVVIDLFFDRLGRFMSPKGKTVCRLIDSGSAYLGAVVVILYTLSMFGVDTATLVGGVGATALVVTLAANKLIGDLLSGIFIIFDGDFQVGDIVTIGDFRGVVTDITLRTTKLMDINSKDIKIIGNARINELINQSRKPSLVTIDVNISHEIGLIEGEKIIHETLKKLPSRFPDIIGEPEYRGIVKLPEKSLSSGIMSGTVARIAFSCHESKKEKLTYQVYRYLTVMVNRLWADDSEIGLAGCDVNAELTPASSAEKAEENKPEESADQKVPEEEKTENGTGKI